MANRLILLAEDDSGDVLLMKHALEKAGVTHPMNVVSDGEEAIFYIQGTGAFADRQTHPFPSVLLLDLNMPKKSGFEVLQWIRSQNEFKRLPVVVLSTSNQEQDVRKAYDLGANSYLTKPSNFDELVEMVKMVDTNWLKINVPPPAVS
ncbi:MAG: response regulator [Verrucomicrobiota bacterium]